MLLNEIVTEPFMPVPLPTVQCWYTRKLLSSGIFDGEAEAPSTDDRAAVKVGTNACGPIKRRHSNATQ